MPAVSAAALVAVARVQHRAGRAGPGTRPDLPGPSGTARPGRWTPRRASRPPAGSPGSPRPSAGSRRPRVRNAPKVARYGVQPRGLHADARGGHLLLGRCRTREGARDARRRSTWGPGRVAHLPVQHHHVRAAPPPIAGQAPRRTRRGSPPRTPTSYPGRCSWPARKRVRAACRCAGGFTSTRGGPWAGPSSRMGLRAGRPGGLPWRAFPGPRPPPPPGPLRVRARMTVGRPLVCSASEYGAVDLGHVMARRSRWVCQAERGYPPGVGAGCPSHGRVGPSLAEDGSRRRSRSGCPGSWSAAVLETPPRTDPSASFAVTAQHPDPVGQLIEEPAGQGEPDNRPARPSPSEPVATVHPGQPRGGMPLQAAAPGAVAEQLVVVDRARRPR